MIQHVTIFGNILIAEYGVRKMLKKMCKKGFTLIEVMIVVAIVAILIAFLIPIIISHRQSYTPQQNNVQIEQTIEVDENENSGDKKL
jgi:prepilin-type N-terminal cleavage/methylation domain-containing protein